MPPDPIRHALGALNRLWPLPALLAWSTCWTLFFSARSAGFDLVVASVGVAGVGVAASLLGRTPWRRVFIGAGFPLSLAASGAAASLPAWAWLLPLGLLAVLYPINTWRDAPLFPTPTGGLTGLAQLAPLQPGARAVDAGCGLGAGLRELHREYPQIHLDGLEWSWPLRWLCAARCRFARVRRADIWASDWSGYDLVYVFQRPESMARAWAKASCELRPGRWLVSLEFAVPGVAATARLEGGGGRRVWLYQVAGETESDRTAGRVGSVQGAVVKLHEFVNAVPLTVPTNLV